MAEIRVENGTKRFGKFMAVENISMTIEDQVIWLRFPADKIRFIDPDSGQALV